MNQLMFGARYKEGKDGRRVFKIGEGIAEIINEQNWDTIWDELGDLYPNLKGRVDFAEVCKKIVQALPDIEDGILVSRKDMSKVAESICNCLLEILIVYENIYKHNGVGVITS